MNIVTTAKGNEELHEELTQREMEVLQSSAEGLANIDIAKRLGISEKNR
ncbi:MAG: LuxR C-terminal-related transcriptional regulator [Rickettsiales bacterium]